jgi:hypothetical protein
LAPEIIILAPLSWGQRCAATNLTIIIVFDLAISRDYVMTVGHDILKVLNIKDNLM